MKQVTLKQLKKHVDELVKKGLGDCKLVVSDDNEGNGFHGMFFTLTAIKALKEEDKAYYQDMINDSNETDLDNIIIVG